METWIMPVVIGISVSIGLAIASARQKKKNNALTPSIVEHLQAGDMSLPKLAEALGKGSFMGRGKVTLALNDLVTTGAVRIITAPEGTPQLKKVDHILYRLEDGAKAEAA